MEPLEGLKKSCFTTISRFYYPKMPPQKLSNADLQKLSPVQGEGCFPRGESRSATLEAYRIPDFPCPLLKAESLSGPKFLCLVSFLWSDAKTHLGHFKVEEFL